MSNRKKWTIFARLLIEPLWNWNSFFICCNCCASIAFNRTTMELKPVITFWLHLIPCALLIEPLWNWNPRRTYRPAECSLPFNRTTMELKLNRRNARLVTPCVNPTFNRTTMELKHCCAWAHRQHCIPFNRTTMELKHTNSSFCLLIQKPFNRTTMELKQVFEDFFD